MKIKELHLVNFGKFTNRKIELDDKLTIVYGENEAGKSTIFYFIVGMFYGFYKPYIKNRKLLDIHETYNPWSGGGYSGSLLFYDDKSKRDLRLERNFAQGQESIKVFIEASGEEITQEYSLHPVFRLPDIAAKHIGVSYTTFINTLAIKQLGHETDENLDKELKETVVNALSTHNIDVSVNKVQAKISKELDAIGSGRRKTSTYYLKKQKIMALENELEHSMAIHQEILQAKDKRRELALDKEKALANLRLIQCIEEFRNLEDRESTLVQGRNIKKTLVELEAKQKELNVTDEFSIHEIEQGIEAYGQLNFTTQQLSMSNKMIEDVETEIAQLKGELNKPQTLVDDQVLEKLTKDIYSYAQLNNESHEINREIALLMNDKEKQDQRYETLDFANGFLKKSSIKAMILGVVGLLVLVISLIFMMKSSLLVIGAICGSISIVFGIYLTAVNKHKLEKTKHDEQQLINEIKSMQVRIETQKTLSLTKANQGAKLLQGYHVDDLPSLTSLKDRWLKESMAEASISKLYENQLVNLEKLHEKRKQLLQAKEEFLAKSSYIENQLRPITSYFQINDSQELKKVKERLVEFLSLSKTLEHEKLRLNDVLKSKVLEEVEVALEEDKKSFNKALEKLKSEDVINQTWFKSDEALEMFSSKDLLTETINDIDQKLAGILSKSEALSRGHRRISEVEEDLIAQKDALEGLDFNKKVFELIGETISTITDELQHNFAPLLNESVSNMVETITANKYQDIKINPQMLMRLKDPATHQMINASQLSRGTMDLFYLALRDALATWVIGDKELPVLLDETFAHFDDARLESALNLFSKSKRQVILFTCQKREVELSKKSALARLVYL